mmetsp:Transcript_88339/g.166468  ORF Transcript_88339/g.166468 Transcript_88339/m.166468 type:complete len:509 (+) Transcript_88339:103-1629(+)
MEGMGVLSRGIAVRSVATSDPSATGLHIQGKTGRHALVNGTYEPMTNKHHDRAVWVSRAVQPVYIFHTGKSRWVISKRLDDGSRCYAFIKDQSGAADPSDIDPQQWVCCDDDGEWRASSSMSCHMVPSSTDKFVQLRMTLDNEMTQLGLTNVSALSQLWKRLDYNGNGVVSLAEIDKLVVEMIAGGSWPAWLDNKPALMRAYKKTILKDGDGDDWVEKKEFHALMLNIFWFNKLWQVFDAVDTGDDRRIDIREFVRGMQQLGLHINDQEAMAEFQKIDRNSGGQVLFVEFCAYIRKRVSPDANPNFDGDIISGEKCGQAIRRSLGHKATHTHTVTRKCLAKFDDLEKEFKNIALSQDKLRSLWDRIDFNGNNIVSLAEIDKLCVEAFPLLNHKPALMRAYKATINAKDSDGDDWVDKKEFKCLLGNLIYFNKVFWLFDNVGDSDKDRRLTLKEFTWCLSCLGEKMNANEARQEFSRVDRNGGGIILFDEFCKYLTSRKCPEALSEFIG